MFEPKPLRANFKDYEPVISERIMDLHYNNHYLGYLEKLNNAVEKFAHLTKRTIPELLAELDDIPEEIRLTVRNNGGGAINHEIFWSTLSTEQTSIHDGPFKEAMEKKFGSWEDFIHQMVLASGKLFGSGWVWLCLNKNTRDISIVNTSNQDSPYMYGRIPVFGVDVWEHAYYLQYGNVRKEYVENVLKIIDWREVEHRFLTAK